MRPSLLLTLFLGACEATTDDRGTEPGSESTPDATPEPEPEPEPALADDDGDGFTADVDCDDSDDSVYPGADEVLDDWIDQDCDGEDAWGEPVFAQVSAGIDTTCALTSAGRTVCWGGSDVVPDRPLASLDVGGTAACGVTPQGALHCWGDDTHGLLSPPEGGGWVQVSVGLFHACAVDDAGAVSCWGSSSYGEADVGGLPADWTVQSVSAGSHYTCLVVESEGAHCFGLDFFDQTPSLEEGAWAGAVAVSAGETHTCALFPWSGDCVGKNDDGQTQESFDFAYPYDHLSAGGAHTCGRFADGGLHCWGANDQGQIEAPAGNGWVQVSAGRDHSCALDEAGDISCWGSDDQGQVRDAP